MVCTRSSQSADFAHRLRGGLLHLCNHLIAGHERCRKGRKVGSWAQPLPIFGKANSLYEDSGKNRVHLCDSESIGQAGVPLNPVVRI